MLRIDTTIVDFLPGLVVRDVGEVALNWVNKQLVLFNFCPLFTILISYFIYHDVI